jgi:hypothetical protein
MAVAFDAASTSGDLSNLTTKSWSHTCSGVDRALYVIICGYDAESNLSGVTVTYNGVSMTKLGGNQDTDNNNTLIYELVNPPTGSNTVQISGIPASYVQAGACAVSYVGVDQSDPTPGAVVNGANVATVNVPSLSAGDIALMAFYDGDNDNPNPDTGTKRASQLMASSARAIAADRDGTGTVTCAFTGVADPMISAVRIKASPGGPFGGGLTAQAADIDGAVVTTVVASGSLQAQAGIVTGRINALRISATLAAQAAQINGTLSLAGLFYGILLPGAADVDGVVSPIVTFTGAIISQNSLVVGDFEPAYIHLESAMISQQASISGSVQITAQRPPRQFEVRSQRKGYKRPFTFYVDET